MNERRWLSWASAVLGSVVLFGCVEEDGDSGPMNGQIGGVHGGETCQEEEEPIGLDDASPLGFSAAEVIAAVSGERTAQLTWAKGGSTTATLSVGAPVAARFVESTVATGTPPNGQEPAIAVVCSDYLEIDVPLSFSTEDGAFAETFSLTLRATQADTAAFYHSIDLSALEGSYQVTEVDPAEFNKLWVYLSGTISGSAVSGEITGMAESFPSGSGPDATVSATRFDVAEF